MADVQRVWLGLRASWSAQPRPEAPQAAGQADAFVPAIEPQLSRLTVILNAVQVLMVALLCSAYLFVFNPLARVQAGLARVGEGDLAARVEAAAFAARATSLDELATCTGLDDRRTERKCVAGHRAPAGEHLSNSQASSSITPPSP